MTWTTASDFAQVGAVECDILVTGKKLVVDDAKISPENQTRAERTALADSLALALDPGVADDYSPSM